MAYQRKIIRRYYLAVKIRNRNHARLALKAHVLVKSRPCTIMSESTFHKFNWYGVLPLHIQDGENYESFGTGKSNLTVCLHDKTDDEP